MSVEWAFQQALYGALSGDVALKDIVSGIHDIPPQAADGGGIGPYPYITIGLTIATEDDTGSTLGWNVVARLHTWSRSGSARECKQIQGLIYDALHRHEFAMAGFNHYSLTRQISEMSFEADGVAHGICEYRAQVEKA